VTGNLGRVRLTSGPVHPEWPARLHVITGKGGTGKTSVAAALALALAAGGHRILLVEVEGRQGIAQLFGTDPLPYQERTIATTGDGGEVRALAVDPEQALLEYLDRFYRLGVAGRALRRVGAIDFATTIAPGVRDVLLTGKVKEATTRTDSGRRVYRAVVLDAPPAGRIARFLNVTAETARLARVGPIKTQSEGVAALLRSPMTAVHMVTLLEEMPVQETADTLVAVAGLGVPLGKIIINATRPPLLTGASWPVSRAGLRNGLTAAGLPADPATVGGLYAEASERLARERLESALRADVAELGYPTVELPLLADGVDPAGLATLAAALCPPRP
jgi:Mrp family chromosome partitioning ATPase